MASSTPTMYSSFLDLSALQPPTTTEEKRSSTSGLRRTASLPNIDNYLQPEQHPTIRHQPLAERSQSLPAISSPRVSVAPATSPVVDYDQFVHQLCEKLVTLANEQGIYLTSQHIDHLLVSQPADAPDISPKTVQDNHGETVLFNLIRQYTKAEPDKGLILRQLIDTLLGSGFDAVEHNQDGENVLDYILSRKHYVSESSDLTSLLLYLIQVSNISMDHIGKDGQTPLTRMIQSGEFAKARLLIKEGANPNTRNQQGESPLYLCVKHQQHEIARELLSNDAHMTTHRYDGGEQALIHFALDQVDLNMVELLFRHTKDDDIDERDVKNQTALMRVCALSEKQVSPEVVQQAIRLANEMLDHRANVTLYSKSLESSLIYTLRALLNDTDKTCIESRKTLANRLIEMGSNHSLQSRDEQTPIRLALAGHHFDIVALLLKKGATIDESYRNQHTALTQYVFDRNVEMVKKLLTEFQASPNKSARGRLPLQEALIQASQTQGQTREQWLEIVELLVDHEADLNLHTRKHPTVPTLLINRRDKELFKLMLTRESKASWDVLSVDKERTPITWSLDLEQQHKDTPEERQQYRQLFEKLLRLGTAVDTQVGKDGASALMLAAGKFSNITAVKRLLQTSDQDMPAKKQADIQQRDKQQNTALHHACMNCAADQEASTDIIHYLIEQGADINATNSANQLPICHAISARNPAAVQAMSHVEVTTLAVANSLMASGIEEYITELSDTQPEERDQALLNTLTALRDKALAVIKAHEPTTPSVEPESLPEKDQPSTTTEQRPEITVKKRVPPTTPKKPVVVRPKQLSTMTTETSTDKTTAASTGVQTTQEQAQQLNGEKAALEEKLKKMEAEKQQLMEQLRKQSESEATSQKHFQALQQEHSNLQSRLEFTRNELQALQAAESAVTQAATVEMATATDQIDEESEQATTASLPTPEKEELNEESVLILSESPSAVRILDLAATSAFRLMAAAFTLPPCKIMTAAEYNASLSFKQEEYDILEDPQAEEGASSNLEKASDTESAAATSLMEDKTRPTAETPSPSSDEEQ